MFDRLETTGVGVKCDNRMQPKIIPAAAKLRDKQTLISVIVDTSPSQGQFGNNSRDNDAMKVLGLVAGLSLAISVHAEGDPPPPQVPIILGIISDTPSQCSPGQNMNITFLPDTLKLELPSMRFGAEGHGRTDEIAVCQFTAEFTDWWYKYRFAIRDVTYKGHLNATDGVQLYQLKANIVFRYENRKVNPGRAPPDIWNVSMSTMIDDTANTAIGGDGNFDDDFSVNENSSHLEWSTCMDGGEGTGDVKTKLVFELTATTSDKTGKGTGVLTRGLTFDFGIVWEECSPDRGVKNAWGQTRIDDWSVCTYNNTNQTSRAMSRQLRRGPGRLF
ncbi:hypothetical protein K449DRAFT_459238 [Hypoxylon sp. EC38]|nr:hypothetical protein K449DRAFT_459238 [Hypoxylon sp. EC38]